MKAESKYAVKKHLHMNYMTCGPGTVNKDNIVYAPYKVIVTHCLITDANGTRRIRQVSIWTLFKLLINRIIYKFKK